MMLVRLRSWLRALLHRSSFERNMDDELRFHLESRTEDLMRAGLSRADAVRRARLEFGNPEAYQDRCRESRRLQLFDDLRADVTYALRTVRKEPLLSITIVATLALGIGATTAIFSVVNAVLLRPLPFAQPDRLMMAFTDDSRQRGDRMGRVYGPDFIEWRSGCRACAEMAAYTGTWPTNLAGGAEPERVRVSRVTDRLFETMGVQPLLGRGFLPEDKGRAPFNIADSTAPTAVVLGHALWQRSFGSDPMIVGRTIRIEGDAVEVVGIMPAGFAFPDNADAWLPVSPGAARRNRFLAIVTRLRPGTTAGEAQAELATIARHLEQTFPGTNTGLGVALVPLQEFIVGAIGTSLAILFGAVALVLIIACANVANLLLAHAATRPREMAVRATLGASRLRIVRQLLTESVVFACLGGAAGLWLAAALTNALVSSAPPGIPRLEGTSIDRWVLGFTLATSLVTGLLFGAAPIWRILTTDLITPLKTGGQGSMRGAGGERVRRLLVVAEVALALVLLIGAGLLSKSFVHLRTASIGFDPRKTLSAGVTLPEAVYPDGAQAKAFLERALARIATLPGVERAGMVSALPLGRNGARIRGNITVEGEASERRGAFPSKLAIGGDYFRAMGIPVLKGRDFTEADRDARPGVLIVSASLARRLFPNGDALGKRLNIGFSGETWREIVGIVGDVKHEDLAAEPSSAIYQPFLQVPDNRRWMLGEMTFVARTSLDPRMAAADLRTAFKAIDPDLPLYDVAVMGDVVREKMSDSRFYASLLGTFSMLALVLAAAGIHGLIAYSVAQRTHEIGLRMALGAPAGRVVRMVVREGMGLTAVGVTIGLAAALGATRVLSSFLYQVTVTDPVTFVALALLLAGVALAACYFPARRAMRVSPISALRSE